MTEPLLEFDRVSKQFARSDVGNRARIASAAWRSFWGLGGEVAKLAGGRFWAVQNLCLKVSAGEAVGIIGLNGSGKTTLLRIAAGHFLPDVGEVRARGHLEELVNLTAGFDAKLTGRENLYLASALRGRRVSDLERDFESIVEFAELEFALDAPLSTYSQGMKLRLAFALAIHCKPDVFLIDEVLAVGDFRFQQRCLQRLQRMKPHCAILFASHSIGQVAQFCDRVVVMEAGTPKIFNEPGEAVAYYLERKAQTGERDGATHVDQVTGALFQDDETIDSVDFVWVNADGEKCRSFKRASTVRAELSVRLKRSASNISMSILVFAGDGTEVTSFSSLTAGKSWELSSGKETKLLISAPKFALSPGKYHAVLSVVDRMEVLYRQPVGTLIIEQGSVGHWGMFSTPTQWEEI